MEKTQSDTATTGKMPVVAFTAGLISVVLLAAAIILGFAIDDIGIVSFMSPVMFVALAAIVCGVIARKRVPDSRLGLAGMILGIVVLVFVFIARIAIFLFFLPWLGA